MLKYKRTIDELRENAIFHWPDEILDAAGEVSILPLLLKTQQTFIALLKCADKTPLAWKDALEHTTSLPAPLFLKHLMVMTDLGGEALNKLPPLSKYLPNSCLKFIWQDEEHEYQLQEISARCALSNSALKVDAKNLLKHKEFTPKMLDVAMLLLFAGSAINDSLPTEVKEKCSIGSLIGKSDELDSFITQNYIRVSRQVGGATANALGQLAQDFVITHLTTELPPEWKIVRDGTLPSVSHTTDGRETTFDAVVQTPKGKWIGIEVSFQVTTNSVIERKAREAESLLANAHQHGHKVCYVIDGAGNINIRQHAVRTLCNYSDCTVAMSPTEIKHLAAYCLYIENQEV